MPTLERLLLIEDSTSDVELTKRVINKVTTSIQLAVHGTAETALSYLQTANPLPQLILLDLGLPGMDGIEFIRQMRTIRGLRPIPIVILTGWALDIVRADAAQVAVGYVIKPIDEDEFKNLLSQLGFTI